MPAKKTTKKEIPIKPELNVKATKEITTTVTTVIKQVVIGKDGKSYQPRRTKVQQQQIEKLIYELLMAGNSWHLIMNILQEQHGYKQSNAEKNICKVYKSFKAKAEVESDDLKEQYLEMYLNLYKKAQEAKDLKTAKLIMDSIVKLQGLITNKVEANVNLQNYEIKF